MHLSKVYAEFLNLHSNIKRMDSLMIASNCKRMSRPEIIYTVVANAISLMHRLGARDFIPGGMQHYLDSEDRNNVIYYCKEDDVFSRLDTVVWDVSALKELLCADEWQDFSEYQLRIRVLNEQTMKDDSGKAVARSKNEISPESLQNPSDPDATYRSKTGKDNKGYIGNVIEILGDDGVSLITGISYETNNHSDSAFCREYLESRSKDSDEEIMLTDEAYGDTENQMIAESKNVKLITTALTGRQPDAIMAGFKFTEDGREVISCPAGYKPEKTSYYPKTGMCRVILKKEYCSSCPNRDSCKVRLQHKTCTVSVSCKITQRAMYLKMLSSDEYSALTKKRNGVEGIPSVLQRRYNVDNISARGLLR
ncbi:MAG TPA: transposase [Mobilitalea sp.]|nr:transposase [Mobilitalea sp.]